MRVLHVLAAAAAILAAADLTSAAAPQCSVTAKLSAPKTVLAGRKFTASASIKNTGTTNLEEFYVQFQLPDYLIPMAARASAHASKNGPAPLLEAPFVRFRGLRLPARKTLRLKITAGVPTCQSAGAVQLTGLAYTLDATGMPACLSTVGPANHNRCGQTRGAQGQACHPEQLHGAHAHARALLCGPQHALSAGGALGGAGGRLRPRPDGGRGGAWPAAHAHGVDGRAPVLDVLRRRAQRHCSLLLQPGCCRNVLLLPRVRSALVAGVHGGCLFWGVLGVVPVCPLF